MPKDQSEEKNIFLYIVHIFKTRDLEPHPKFIHFHKSPSFDILSFIYFYAFLLLYFCIRCGKIASVHLHAHTKRR